MSDELSAIHAQTSAIFEKLYDENGQPEQLDETFLQQYFTLIQENIKFGADDNEFASERPIRTHVRLSQPAKGLIDVLIPGKAEKFIVSDLQSVQNLGGTSQRFGAGRGKGNFVMTNPKGIPHVTVKTPGGVVVYLGDPHRVHPETGKGKWIKE